VPGENQWRYGICIELSEHL
jgi:hypothetical protein